MSVKTPTAVEHLLDQIAEDKAIRLRTLSRATIIQTVCPEWAQAEEVVAWFGLPINQLRKLAYEHKVCAKKSDPGLRGSAVLFRVADVRREIDKMPDWVEWMMANNMKGETK